MGSLSHVRFLYITSNVYTVRTLYLFVYVYYVAVRTIVLSRHGSNLTRPVIINDIIHSLMCMPSTPHCGFSVSHRMETAPTPIEVLLRPTLGQSDEPSVLRGSLSPTSVYSTWQSHAITHPIMNRARRCLTSVIEHKPLDERRIPYMYLYIIIIPCNLTDYSMYSVKLHFDFPMKRPIIFNNSHFLNR